MTYFNILTINHTTAEKLDGHYNSVNYYASAKNMHSGDIFDSTMTLTQTFDASILAQSPSAMKVWSNSINNYSR